MAGGGQADFTDNPAELLQASPSIVLADPGPHADTGRVLSVAPLMGATASIDSSHVRWLHVKVRPPARGLLKAARVTLCFCSPFFCNILCWLGAEQHKYFTHYVREIAINSECLRKSISLQPHIWLCRIPA